MTTETLHCDSSPSTASMETSALCTTIGKSEQTKKPNGLLQVLMAMQDLLGEMQENEMANMAKRAEIERDNSIGAANKQLAAVKAYTKAQAQAAIDGKWMTVLNDVLIGIQTLIILVCSCTGNLVIATLMTATLIMQVSGANKAIIGAITKAFVKARMKKADATALATVILVLAEVATCAAGGFAVGIRAAISEGVEELGDILLHGAKTAGISALKAAPMLIASDNLLIVFADEISDDNKLPSWAKALLEIIAMILQILMMLGSMKVMGAFSSGDAAAGTAKEGGSLGLSIERLFNTDFVTLSKVSRGMMLGGNMLMATGNFTKCGFGINEGFCDISSGKATRERILAEVLLELINSTQTQLSQYDQEDLKKVGAMFTNGSAYAAPQNAVADILLQG